MPMAQPQEGRRRWAMRRWHEETALMLRRWRAEIEKQSHHRRCYLCKGTKYSRVGRTWRGDGTHRRGRANWNYATMRSEEEANR